MPIPSFGNLFRYGILPAYKGVQQGEALRRQHEQARREAEEKRKRERANDELARTLQQLRIEQAQKSLQPQSPEFGVNVGGVSGKFPTIEEARAAAAGLRGQEPRPLTVSGRQFPDTPEGRQAALEWHREYTASGRAPEGPGDDLSDQTRREGLAGDRRARAQQKVRTLTDAGVSYAEIALAPEVKGVIDPQEIRGLYEQRKRDRQGSDLIQQNRQSVIENREGDDPFAAAIAARLGGQPPADPAVPGVPAARPDAVAAQRPSLEQRIAELKAQGVSKEEARAILLREGYQ